MKTFNELTTSEQFQIVCSIDILRSSLDDYIYQSEFDYACDIVRSLDNVDYNIGICQYSYLKIKDGYKLLDFLYSVDHLNSMYGLHIKTEKQVAKCHKLINSNLFGYECSKLCQMIFDTEIAPIIRYIEDMGYLTYTNTFSAEIEDIFVCWMDNNNNISRHISYDEGDNKWIYAETTYHYSH